MLAAASEGPLDQAADHVGGVNSPWVEAFAVGSPGRLAVILINRSQVARPVTLRIAGLTAPPSSARRYLFSRDRVSAFIGPPPGEKEEGGLAGSPTTPRVPAAWSPWTPSRSPRGQTALVWTWTARP